VTLFPNGGGFTSGKDFVDLAFTISAANSKSRSLADQTAVGATQTLGAV
jgi:hypothetical protein